MPLVEVTIVEGRDATRVRSLIEALTSAVETSLDADRPSVRVIVREVPATHWGSGDETIAERRGRGDP